ncbi:MAG: Smr/MutS family protein [bacterium]|nr:Smr/MutS family protein [bacterium]
MKNNSHTTPIRIIMCQQPKDFSEELDLHHHHIDDALRILDKYLDTAFIYQKSPVYIIHGHGTGKLRKAICEFLARHPQVESFSSAPPNKWGDAATKVILHSIE